MKVLKQFGAQPSLSELEKYSLSKQWNGRSFQNIEPTKADISFTTLPTLLYKQFCEKNDRYPLRKLSIIPFDKVGFEKDDGGFKAVWFGHSAILLRINNWNILIDPMLGPNAAPISPFAVKRFSENTLSIINTLPEIDLVMISHDHYDHLDYDSIRQLKDKSKRFYTALGVGRHLVKWGVDESNITEFDWWNEHTINDIRISFTPTRHFSGRGLKDRAKSLWGGWALQTKDQNIWFSGDGGYGSHFTEIGKRLGPFDFAFMECGQYNKLWHQIHMYPEESVRAAIKAGVTKAMPVHWAAFSLAQHAWTEPVERFSAEAIKMGLDYTVPPLGSVFTAATTCKEQWW